ncbi:tetratricopeptide repeat-containing diguanylate cyclase [Alicyclobacillus acidiphilus]|uniref:tetratricopeptide repeat-containing diguanylate cyclase n=1 Tax=Alicyclobacillus acidiphilus TaxID=182455 RepID=UPI00083796CA|nr:GGDEF domain-containing protein [Alicyclobacillus acidiphilus]
MHESNIQSLQQQVTSLRAKGKYKETIEACFDLLKRGEEIGDYKSILVAHLNSAASYYCIGDIEEAFRCISAYDEVCREHGDETDHLNRHNVLFLLYEYNKDYDKAKSTLDKAINLGTRLRKYNIVSNAYSNYSHLLLVERNFASALAMGKLGLEMAKIHSPSSPILKVRVKLNIAEAYIGLEDFKGSRLFIEEIENESVLDSDTYIREQVQFSMLRGSWYSHQGHYREAFEWLTHARDLVSHYDDIYLLEEIQRERCRLCEQMGDIETGFYAQKEYISVLLESRKRELERTALQLEVKHSLADLKKRATTDHATGLANRYRLESTANEWLREAADRCENIVCIVVDIDHFKRINDQYGHLFGDEVIRQVTDACTSVLRKEDLIGRYGGDEFVVILRGVTLDVGVRKAEQMLEAIRNLNVSCGETPVPISASLGVADNGEGTVLQFNDLFQLADVELYKAKANGRNQISVEGLLDSQRVQN